MESLKRFHQDTEMKGAMLNLFREQLHARCINGVLKKEDTSGLADAAKIIDSVFTLIEQTFAEKDDKPKEDQSE
jgi:hypothetical protein